MLWKGKARKQMMWLCTDEAMLWKGKASKQCCGCVGYSVTKQCSGQERLGSNDVVYYEPLLWKVERLGSNDVVMYEAVLWKGKARKK